MRRSAARPLLATPDLPRWNLVALGTGATRNKLNSSIVTHLADAPSIGPRTASRPPSPPLKRVRRSAARLSPGSTLSTLSRHSLDTVDTVDTGVNRHHLDTTSTPPTLVSTSVDIRDALMLSTGVKSVNNLVSMVSS